MQVEGGYGQVCLIQNVSIVPLQGRWVAKLVMHLLATAAVVLPELSVSLSFAQFAQEKV